VDLAKLKTMLVRHEGVRLKAYRDSVGLTTIGVGRCLDTKGISLAEAMFLLDDDMAEVQQQVAQNIAFYGRLSEARQAVLLDLCFNLGLVGLLKFTHFLSNLENGAYQTAAQDLGNSLWAKQVGPRCADLQRLVVDGVW
jgi:lysozyme